MLSKDITLTPFSGRWTVLKGIYHRTAAHKHDRVWVTDAGTIIVPADEHLRLDIVAEAHQPAVFGHGGVRATTDCDIVAEAHQPAVCGHGGVHAGSRSTSDHMVVNSSIFSLESSFRIALRKSSLLKPAGLLQPLAPATAPWLSIGIDSFTGLPVSAWGNECV